MSIDPNRLRDLVEQRAARWASLGIRWEFRPAQSVGSKPSASVRCESAEAVGELTVWSSGEADLDVGYFGDEEMAKEQYEVTEDRNLSDCLEDLERFMRKRR